MADAPTVVYTKVANLFGPQGRQGIQGFRGEMGPVGPSLPGPMGPAGKPGVDGEITDTAFQTLLKNPESDSYTAVFALILEILNGFTLREVPVVITLGAGDSLSKPRRTTSTGAPWPGPVFWVSTIGRPLYMLDDDLYWAVDTSVGPGGVITPDPVGFDPLTLDGLQLWASPVNANVADGATIATYPDRSPAGHAMTTWTISSTGATTQPVYRVTGMGGKPATELVSRSGFTTTFSVPTPAAVMLAVNAQFTGALPTTNRQHLNTMGDTGKYSISRTSDGKYQASIDGVTFYPFGSIDTAAHTFVMIATATNLSVWVDGVQQLSQTVSLSQLPAVSQVRWGFVGSSGSNANWMYSGGLMLGDGIVTTPASAPTASNVAKYTAWLKSQRGA